MTAPTPAQDAGLAVEAVDVVVHVGRTELVHGVSFAVPRGGWLALLGPNGAGKTTLLRVLAGLMAPSAGHVRVDGLDIRAASPRRRARHVALVEQRPTLPPGMTVDEYVLLGRTAHASLLGVEGPDDRAVAAEAMDRLDVTRFADRDVLTLSGGEAQRVVLARALAQGAPILLLDEPTTALDLSHQHEVLELVDELRRERGLTIVSSLHDLTAAGQFAVDGALLACGELMASGPIADVLDAEVIAAAFGAEVRVLDDGAGGRIVLPVRRADRKSGSDGRRGAGVEPSGTRRAPASPPAPRDERSEP